MKVSTKIISGFGILLLIDLAAFAYQVSITYRMQKINQTLSLVNLEAASIVQRMKQDVFDLEDYSRKYFALSGDPMYERELGDIRTEFAQDLTKLQINVRTSRERGAIDGLSAAWSDFWGRLALEKPRLNPDSGGEPPELPGSLQTAIDKIQTNTDAVLSAVRVGIREQALLAAAEGDRARTVSEIAGVLSMVIAAVVAVILVGTVTDPLRQLTQGTRRISKGQFWHRLPADSGDEFAELARDFNAMAQRLNELDKMKKDFVSHVSHELKAPLASMRQVFLLLLQEIAGPLNEQQRRLLRLSSNSAERLTAMVGNLLDVSRMEAGTMEYAMQPHDLVALVQSVAEEFEVQAHDRKIELGVEASDSVWAECDRDRIVQVVGNLFENALKFAPDNSSIVAKIERVDGDKVRVAVSDSGPGIPVEHKQRIFEKFHQVKQGKKIAGQGVGLGLAICKTIIEAHRGQIWVEDNPPGGSLFCFLLKAVRAAPAATQVLQAAPMVEHSR